MASENLVKELWEIIQKENKEEISYNDFENDLNKALNLSKDESDRALSLMISQAEVNPNLIGEYKDGSFAISSSFTNTVISTIKYENQFIPGKAEYEARFMSENLKSDVILGAVIVTPPLLKNMLDNFENLTDKEVEELAEQFHEMDDDDQRRFKTAQINRIKTLIGNVTRKESKDALTEIQKDLEFEDEVHKRMKEGTLDEETKKAYKTEMLNSSEFRKFYFNLTGEEFTENTEITSEVMDKWFSFSFKARASAGSVINFYDKAQEAIENGDIEEFSRLCSEYPEEAERYLKEFEAVAEKLGINLDELIEDGFKAMMFPNYEPLEASKGVDNQHGTFVEQNGTNFNGNVTFRDLLRFYQDLPRNAKTKGAFEQRIDAFFSSKLIKDISSEVELENIITDVDKEQIEIGRRVRETTTFGMTFSSTEDLLELETDNEDLFYGPDDEKTTEIPQVENDSRVIRFVNNETGSIRNILSYKDNNNDNLLKNEEIKKFFEIYKEEMVVGDVKSQKTSHEDEEHAQGEATEIEQNKRLKDRVEAARAKLKGRKVAGQIVGILRKIGQVRSGEMVEAHNELQGILTQENTLGIEDETISQE